MSLAPVLEDQEDHDDQEDQLDQDEQHEVESEPTKPPGDFFCSTDDWAIFYPDWAFHVILD